MLLYPVVRIFEDVVDDDSFCGGNETLLLGFLFPAEIFVSFGEDVIEIVT